MGGPMVRVGRRGLVAAAAALAMTLGSASAERLPASVTIPDPDGYADTCLAVGAWVPGNGDRAAAAWDRAADLGPLTIRRSFDAGLPEDFAASSAAEDPARGLRSFLSWKPPGGDHRGAVRGAYDEEIVRWARSVPSTGVWGTSFHEPENDMTAEEFVAYHRHVYGLVKAANPGIRWGPVYMAYWWDPANPDHYVGDPAAWWPGEGYADFAGIDWYSPQPEPMTASGSFLHWYERMEPTGLPLLVVEYGQGAVDDGALPDPGVQRARAEAVRADARWIAEHPRVSMWMYWHGPGPRGDWALHDQASRAAWQSVAASGCAA